MDEKDQEENELKYLKHSLFSSAYVNFLNQSTNLSNSEKFEHTQSIKELFSICTNQRWEHFIKWNCRKEI